VLWLVTWLVNSRTNRGRGEPVGTQNAGNDG
jgi:hypothetical protein